MPISRMGRMMIKISEEYHGSRNTKKKWKEKSKGKYKKKHTLSVRGEFISHSFFAHHHCVEHLVSHPLPIPWQERMLCILFLIHFFIASWKKCIKFWCFPMSKAGFRQKSAKIKNHMFSLSKSCWFLLKSVFRFLLKKINAFSHKNW